MCRLFRQIYRIAYEHLPDYVLQTDWEADVDSIDGLYFAAIRP